MAASERDRAALILVDRHTAGRESIWRGVWAQIVRILRGTPSRGFYTTRSQVDAAREIAELVRAAQVATGDHTLSYLDAMLDVQDIAPVRLVEPIPARPRRVDPVEEWLRPFEQFRYEYARSQDEARARDAAELRASKLADSDLGLGMRHAVANHSAANDSVIGFRRVVRPELAVKTGRVCGLCLIASDRVYKRGELLPIHDGCNCTVAEVTRSFDPGSSLNGLSLQDLYDDAGGTGMRELSRVRVRVEQHGELGPYLVAA